MNKMRHLSLQEAKVALQEVLPNLISLQLPGVPFTPLPIAPRHAGFTYFQLDRTTAGWQKLMPKGANGFGFHPSGNFPELQLQFWATRSQ